MRVYIDIKSVFSVPITDRFDYNMRGAASSRLKIVQCSRADAIFAFSYSR